MLSYAAPPVTTPVYTGRRDNHEKRLYLTLT